MAPIVAGTKVPDFTLKTEALEDFTQSDLEGRTSVLVFYPAAFSPVCTDQLQAVSYTHLTLPTTERV